MIFLLSPFYSDKRECADDNIPLSRTSAWKMYFEDENGEARSETQMVSMWDTGSRSTPPPLFLFSLSPVSYVFEGVDFDIRSVVNAAFRSVE